LRNGQKLAKRGTMTRMKRQQKELRGQPSHREDLRGELLAAAVALVEREGHEGLSMRKLADEVGVSPGAPYHHFADRRALLAAVALEGYQAMLNLTEVNEGNDKDPRDSLFNVSVSFIRFAEKNPHMFTLMYESELVRPKLSPELAAAQEEGFQLLRALVAKVTSHLSDDERAVRVATIWSAIFGFALQSNRAMIRAYPLEPAPDQLAPEIVRQALRLLD
jgi:AcrR family transcriptional regulator